MTIRLAVAALTDTGRVRTNNEDAFLVADLTDGVPPLESNVARFHVGARGAILAVSDGMGGHQGGEVASAITLESLHRELLERTSMPGADERVKNAVEQANRDVIAAGSPSAGRKMGATLTAILIQGTNAHVAQIGDSRAYLLRAGEIRQITHDQSYVQVLLDTGAIDEDEAKSSPMRNVLVQAIGQTPNIQAALGILALRQKDCLVLCSDGLHGKLTPDEILETVIKAPTLDVACAELVKLANDRGGEDNITVLLAGVGAGAPLPAPGERISKTLQVLTTFDARGKVKPLVTLSIQGFRWVSQDSASSYFSMTSGHR